MLSYVVFDWNKETHPGPGYTESTLDLPDAAALAGLTLTLPQSAGVDAPIAATVHNDRAGATAIRVVDYTLDVRRNGVWYQPPLGPDPVFSAQMLELEPGESGQLSLPQRYAPLVYGHYRLVLWVRPEDGDVVLPLWGELELTEQP